MTTIGTELNVLMNEIIFLFIAQDDRKVTVHYQIDITSKIFNLLLGNLISSCHILLTIKKLIIKDTSSIQFFKV